MLPVSHLTQQTSQVNQPVPTSPLATWLQAWNSASATSQAALAASSRFGRAWEDLFRFGGTIQSPQPTQNFCKNSEFLSFFVL